MRTFTLALDSAPLASPNGSQHCRQFLPTFAQQHLLMLVTLLVLSIVTFSTAKAQTKYTADFATQPTIDKYGFENTPGGWPWNSTIHVTLGGVEYLITNAINDSFHWSNSAISYQPYSGVSLLIKRKDEQAFSFYGVDLNYTSVNTNLASAPWLTVSYQGDNGDAAPADAYNETSKNFSVAKPNGVTVKSVQLYFADLATLVLDNLVVGPSSGSPPVSPPTFTKNPSTTAVCTGTSATFNVTASNATSFQWQEASNASFTSPTTLSTGGIYSISTSGNASTLTIATNSTVNGKYYRAVATNTGGSTNSAGATLTVNPLPVLTINGLASAYCKDASAVTLSASPAGGTFTIDQNTATQVNPSVLSVGMHTVHYSYTNSNGCSASISQVVTINALPTVSITGLANAYCKDASAVTLSGSPSGGSFTVDTNPATQLNPALLTPGTHVVGYQYTDGNGCMASTTKQVTVNALPSVAIAGLGSAYCKDAASVTLAGLASPPGGNFSIDGTPATAFNPASLTIGAHTVLYSFSDNNGCTNSASQTVTVNPLPNVSISGLPTAYCQDAAPVSLAPFANPAGGNFAIDGPNATVLTPSSLSIGQHLIAYSYTDANGCTNGASQQITIKEVPAAPIVLTQTGNPYPGGVANLTISQNTGNVILTVSGCGGGTISWAGGSSSTLAVSTSSVGSFSYSATCERNGCTSALATAVITVNPTTLSVSHRDADFGNTGDAIIRPYLQLTNEGNSPIPYGEITVRYWFTSEGNALPTNLAVYYAQLGTQKVKMKYVSLAEPHQGAFGYVEYSFDGSAGSLPGLSNSGPIENGIQKTDRSNFNERDDYSYASATAYAKNSHITAYRNGVIFWGQEPAVVPQQMILKVYSAAKDSPVTSSITTRLEVRNEGNVPIAAQSIKVRYWFSSDNGQPANVYVDYADVGAQNIQARVVTLAQPIAGADSYVELRYVGSAFNVSPLSSLGVIDFRLVRSDNGLLTQSNDYSYRPIAALAENDHITIYLNDNLAYGTPPTGAPARLGNFDEPTSGLQVRVLGNPVLNTSAQVEISGIAGQSFQLEVIDLQGRVWHRQQVGQAAELERLDVPLGSAVGHRILQISTANERQQIKLIKL